MDSVSRLRVTASLQPLVAMAVMLERLEQLPRGATAEQYREVACRVQALLEAVEPSAELDRVLALLPATAELYENLHYATAGLCRSDLDAAARSEFATRNALRAITGHSAAR
jgi:hypothetical protein